VIVPTYVASKDRTAGAFVLATRETEAATSATAARILFMAFPSMRGF
jgi:hypothetical protein